MLTKSELKAWTDALRANPEQQIGSRLVNRDATGFCCLGKLCQTLGYEPELMSDEQLGFLGSNSTLPMEVRQRLRINGSPVPIDQDGTAVFKSLTMPQLRNYSSLAHANDNGTTWAEIADHLDKYYPAIGDAPDEA
jgi:hypothetical protein